MIWWVEVEWLFCIGLGWVGFFVVSVFCALLLDVDGLFCFCCVFCCCGFRVWCFCLVGGLFWVNVDWFGVVFVLLMVLIVCLGFVC